MGSETVTHNRQVILVLVLKNVLLACPRWCIHVKDTETLSLANTKSIIPWHSLT